MNWILDKECVDYNSYYCFYTSSICLNAFFSCIHGCVCGGGVLLEPLTVIVIIFSSSSIDYSCKYDFKSMTF